MPYEGNVSSMKKLEFLESERFRSKQFISEISESLKNIDPKIRALKKSKQKTDALIKKFDIQCYNYNLVDEMLDSRNRLVKDFEKILKQTRITKTVTQKELNLCIKKICYVNELLDNYKTQLNIIKKENLDDIEALQMNAIKKGIYNKFMLIKSDIDRSKVRKKFDKMQSNTKLIKVLEFFWGKIESYDVKKENLFFIIHSIDETRDCIQKNTAPDREYKIIEIMADIKLFLRQYSNWGKYTDKINELVVLRNNIEDTFSIDRKKLKAEMSNKQKSNLPVVVNKKMNKALKERYKIISYLNQNGYIIPSNGVYFGNSNMGNVIKRMNVISQNIERVLY